MQALRAAEKFDVVISYPREDSAWVRTLAEGLRAAGHQPVFDPWEVTPSGVAVHSPAPQARVGILVVSPTTLGHPWLIEEQAAFLWRSRSHGQRWILARLGSEPMPESLTGDAVDVGAAGDEISTAALQELLRVIEEPSDVSGLARSSYQIGVVYHARKEPDEAIRWFRRAIDLFTQTEDRDALAQANLQMGQVFSEQGDLERAEESFTRSRELFEATGRLSEAQVSGRRLGAVLLRSIGRPEVDSREEKLRTVVRVLSLARHYREPRLAAGALRCYGAILDSEDGGSDQAVETEIGKLKGADPATTAELAWVRLVQRRYDEAMRLSRLVIEGASDERTPEALIQSLYVLGEALLVGGSEEGQEEVRHGLRLAQREGIKPLVAQGYLRLGNAQLMRQDFEDARLSYLTAASVYRQIDMPQQVLLCYKLLVVLSRDVGRIKDADRFRDTAETYLKNAGHPEWIEQLSI